MTPRNDVPVIFNLFPRHFRSIDEWQGIIPHVKEMAFNAVFVNPFHETGSSGSLYAVKDYYRLNPLFLRKGADPSDFTPLRSFIDTVRREGLEVIMDLVVNHTAIDSVLTSQHPAWYKRDNGGRLINPHAIDPGNPGSVTVWGDLAIIDNHGSSDRNGLWDYWDHLVAHYQDMGIFGFRCDAAYQVPASLWKRLISSAKQRHQQTKFYAETLGCQLSEIEALNGVGFDYLFNSSKWWDFDKPWALEQHQQNKHIAPSIGFAESHDTERLASVHPGSEAVQKSRYAFAAIFSKGVMMTQGYEHGAATKMDVVRGTPADVEKPKWDITPWVKEMNQLKLSIPVLCEEGRWRPLSDFNYPYIFLEKSSDTGAGKVYVCINKDRNHDTEINEWLIPQEVKHCSKAIQLVHSPSKTEAVLQGFSLDPADIVLFM